MFLHTHCHTHLTQHTTLQERDRACLTQTCTFTSHARHTLHFTTLHRHTSTAERGIRERGGHTRQHGHTQLHTHTITSHTATREHTHTHSGRGGRLVSRGTSGRHTLRHTLSLHTVVVCGHCTCTLCHTQL